MAFPCSANNWVCGPGHEHYQCKEDEQIIVDKHRQGTDRDEGGHGYQSSKKTKNVRDPNLNMKMSDFHISVNNS